MKRLLTITLTLMLSALTSQAQSLYGETLAIRLWDNASAPHSNGLEGPEVVEAPHRIAHTTEAVLYLFAADPARATGQGIVICPGGGYHRLAMDNEGFLMARWFAEHGITAAVLKYRMPNGRPEVPLEDAEQALRILRGETAGTEAAAVGKALPGALRQVGLAGASAGGHLAALTATTGVVRPDFSVLFYPVITGETGWCHAGSFDNLLGRDRTAQLTAQFSLENRVDDRTPPALIFHSDDDQAVPALSATRYYEALRRQGIAASLHIFPTGGHGWGMNEAYTYKEAWRTALLDWLARMAEKME